MATYNESTGGTTSAYNSGWETLFNKAQNVYNQQAGQAVPTQQIAGFTPQQQQAFDLAGQSVGNYQPLMNQAASYTQQAATGAQFDPSQVQQYLNPYIGGVVDEIARLGNENFTQSVLPALSNSFGGLGQFGSARQAAMMADAAGRSQREILGQQSGALNTAYNNAMNQYFDWAGLQSGAAQQAGAQMGNLAQAQQQLSTGDIGNLATAGLTQQQLAQKQNDATYQQKVQQLQYPWEQMNQWANVFKSGTPSQTTSWQTQFKKGGLARARYASGGAFRDARDSDPKLRDVWEDYTISPEVQRVRDNDRVRLLLDELRSNSDDVNLISELMNEGVSLDDMAHYPVAPPKSTDSPITSASRDRYAGSLPNALANRAFDERIKLLERVRDSSELGPMEEGSWVGRAGEAMLRAGAQGPANYGQLIGRAGAEYFDQRDRVAAENNRRAMQQLALEEKIAPQVGRGGIGGAGASEAYTMVRGQDGRTYMVNRLNPQDKYEIGTGTNQSKVESDADRYAREMIKDTEMLTDEERAQRYEFHKRQYIIQRGGGAPSSTTGPGVMQVGARSASETRGDPNAKVIPTVSEAEEHKQSGKAVAKQFDEMREGYDRAIDRLDYLTVLEKNLEGYETGKITPITTEIAAWAEPFGIKIAENLDGRQAFQKFASELALQLRNPSSGAGMPGALSDKDLEFLKAMVPRLENTQGANRKIIDIMRQISQRSAERYRAARQYKAQNPRKSLDGFEEEWDRYIADNPLFAREEAPAAPATAARRDPPKAGEVYKGHRFRGGNPRDPANWEKVQ